MNSTESKDRSDVKDFLHISPPSALLVQVSQSAPARAASNEGRPNERMARPGRAGQGAVRGGVICSQTGPEGMEGDDGETNREGRIRARGDRGGALCSVLLSMF